MNCSEEITFKRFFHGKQQTNGEGLQARRMEVLPDPDDQRQDPLGVSRLRLSALFTAVQQTVSRIAAELKEG